MVIHVAGPLRVAVRNAVALVQSEQYQSPDVIVAHPSIGYLMLREHHETASSFNYLRPDQAERHVFGLTLELDPFLTVDGWRLCDNDGTLLYDARQDKHTQAALTAHHAPSRARPIPDEPFDPRAAWRRLTNARTNRK